MSNAGNVPGVGGMTSRIASISKLGTGGQDSGGRPAKKCAKRLRGEGTWAWTCVRPGATKLTVAVKHTGPRGERGSGTAKQWVGGWGGRARARDLERVTLWRRRVG